MRTSITAAFGYLNNKINRGHQRSVLAKKNILAAFIFKGSSIAISLILVPLTIHYVNPTQYGIWLTLSSIIGWFGFFDIGFGHGLRNKLTEAIASKKYKLSRIYISTTYAILSIIVGVLLLLFFVINPLINWSSILNADASMTRELGLLSLIVFSFFCLQFVLQLITTVLTADQQPGFGSIFNFLGNVISLAVIFILTKTTSGNLLYMGIVLGLTPVLVLGLSNIWFYTHSLRHFSPSLKMVRFSMIGNIFNIGVKFFMLQIAGLLLYESSNIIIAHLFGPSNVTTYNIAFKYFSVIPMVFTIIMLPFWSAFTKAWVEKDITWIKNTIRKLQFLWLGLAMTAIIMLTVSDYVYRIWVGKNIVVPISLSAAIAAYVIVNSWNAIYSQFLNGVGKVKLQLYYGIGGALLNVPLAVYLGYRFGIAGVIFSSVMLTSVNMICGYIQYSKIINKRATGIWAK
jgi:O-antigen/teichoic acid export membrane protein